MKFSDLTVLLPCHSLEDFPVYYEGGPCGELLAAWCAPWHPALLHAAGKLPEWHRVDVPPETLAGRLMTLPPFCLDRLPSGFVDRASDEGGRLVQQSGLDDAVAAALRDLDGGDAGISAELAADFLALGFCRLQIELLTRQMRYSVNLDETHFQNEALAAAGAAAAGDEASAREHLLACFEALYEVRKHYYPVDVYLVDLTLVAETTLGALLAAELAGGTPTNLCLPTALLGEMAEHHGASWSALLAAIDAGTAAVAGGESSEGPLPLWPLEMVRQSLAAGVDQYEALLGRRPQVYARRRAGLWPALPQLLSKFAYQAALHFTLDDGRFPLGQQSKARWEGLDMSVVDVLARLPLDAAKSDTYLSLPRQLADSMDNDHVATLAFAHWPAASGHWHAMLRRVARLSGVLGKFMLLDDYFSHTDMPGRLSKFAPDAYRTPYLKQAIVHGQGDPISQFVRDHRGWARRAAVEATEALADMVRGRARPDKARPEAGGRRPEGAEDEESLQQAAAQLAGVLPRAAARGAGGFLVVNPQSFGRRIGVDVSRLKALPVVAGAVVAAGADGQRKFAVVDVPSMGFAWVEAAASSPATSRAKPIAAENVLRNEFFEVIVSRSSGGIQSLYDFNRRGNQLSQQLAFRLPAPPAAPGEPWRDPDAAARYSTMRAESVEITAASTAFGQITSRGTLVDDGGRTLAVFRQTIDVWAGSRLVRLAIELEPQEEPRADPWNSYYAARFAWPDETADLYRGVALGRQKTESGRLEAPEYIEIEDAGGTVTLFAGGLPYHRRSDPRMLDTLLVTRGESARRFELAIGVDVAQPAAAALELIAPAVVRFDEGPAPVHRSGWLFHLNAKNVVATHWSALHDEPEEGDPVSAAPRDARFSPAAAGNGGPRRARRAARVSPPGGGASGRLSWPDDRRVERGT